MKQMYPTIFSLAAALVAEFNGIAPNYLALGTGFNGDTPSVGKNLQGVRPPRA